MKSAFLTFVAGLAVCCASFAVAEDSPNVQTFYAWVDGHEVVLKRPLYTATFAYILDMGLGSTEINRGIVCLSPTLTFYKAADVLSKQDYVADGILAATPGGLLAIIRAHPGVLKSPPPKLVTFPIGSRMIVKAVVWPAHEGGLSNRVELRLFPRGSTDLESDYGSTSLDVYWPTPFSDGFLEMERVRDLLRGYLTIGPKATGLKTREEIIGAQSSRAGAEVQSTPPRSRMGLGITRAAFAELLTGMSDSEAILVIGSAGDEASRVELSGVPTTVAYVWKNQDGSNILAIFQDDKLVSKANAGLK